MTDHVTKILYRALKTYHIPITYRSIEQSVRTHPEFPSMQCISDALDKWKVKHIVLKLSLEKLQFLDVPVLSHLKKRDSKWTREEYIWIKQVTDTKVHFKNSTGKEIVESRDDFEREWSGVALAIEDITDAGEPDYREQRMKEIKEKLFRYAIAGGCMVLLILLTCLSWFNDSVLSLLFKLLLLSVNTLGCYISYVLIQQEKNQSTKLAQRFCTAGTHIDCNQVTKSRYSKLFGMISWAEFGMAYFCAVILWVAIAPLSANWLSPICWLLLVSLPFTIWSIFTQAFLIRKWCLFCCMIVLLIWINSCILFFTHNFTCVLPIVESALLALLMLVCISVVMYICKTEETGDKYIEQRETARIKYNYRTMKSQLSESTNETNHAGLVWENQTTRHEITIYVSIACTHCGTAIKELRKLTEIFPDFSYRIIFAVHSNDFENQANIITHHFICLHKTLDKNTFFDMLDAWYTKLNKNLVELQKAFPVMSDQDCKTEINALYQFRQQANINYTPAILVDGRLLSQLYSYQDLFGIARSLNAEE